MDASVEQLKRRWWWRRRRRRRRAYRDEGSDRERVCVCRKEGEQTGGSSVCACVCGVSVSVCVWKKEAEPVNGELAGFLPLGTSAVLLFMWTLSSTATTARPKAAGAAPRAAELALQRPFPRSFRT